MAFFTLIWKFKTLPSDLNFKPSLAGTKHARVRMRDREEQVSGKSNSFENTDCIMVNRKERIKC